MDCCIIIGFSYSSKYEDKTRPFLDGIIIDLYLCYRYVKELTDKSNIIVITDQTTNVNSTNKNIIFDETDNINVLKFIDELHNNKILHLYTSKSELLSLLNKKLNGSKNIFFYYTGHSYSGNILLPKMNDMICYNYLKEEDTILNFLELRNIICSNSNVNAEIFIILDCCNSNGLELPYKLSDGVYRLNFKKEGGYPLQKIVCFSSTYIDENSIILKNGSIFTKLLFDNIKIYRKIQDLLKIIVLECLKDFDQNANVYSSYPNIKMIWRWLVKNDDIKVEIDHINNFFILKRK